MQLSASPPLLYTDLKPSHAQAAHLVYSYAWARPKVDTVASTMISRGAHKMQSHHWFLLGMMVAWTPSLIILAVMLRSDAIVHDTGQ